MTHSMMRQRMLTTTVWAVAGLTLVFGCLMLATVVLPDDPAVGRVPSVRELPRFAPDRDNLEAASQAFREMSDRDVRYREVPRVLLEADWDQREHLPMPDITPDAPDEVEEPADATAQEALADLQQKVILKALVSGRHVVAAPAGRPDEEYTLIPPAAWRAWQEEVRTAPAGTTAPAAALNGTLANDLDDAGIPMRLLAVGANACVVRYEFRGQRFDLVLRAPGHDDQSRSLMDRLIEHGADGSAGDGPARDPRSFEGLAGFGDDR